jgi:hypothetical protein
MMSKKEDILNEKIIKLTTEQLQEYVKDDPVRPHLDAEFRTTYNCETFALEDGGDINAIICVAHIYGVPTCERDLTTNTKLENDYVVTPYTVWSYSPGAGRRLVNGVIDKVRHANKNAEVRIITMSPKTEMAKKFHISNGAAELQVNEDTVNFEYLV